MKMFKKHDKYLLFILLQVFLITHTSTAQTRSIDLSPAESKFLTEKSTFPYCVDPNFMPYEQINAQGQHEGLFADFLSLIASKAGINLTLVPTKNYQQSRDFFKRGRCVVIAGDTVPESKVEFLSTEPYYIAESAFAVHSTLKDNIDFKDISTGKTGYIDGADLSLVKKNYPSVNLVPVSSDLEGIRKVASGELDSFVSTMATIDYTIKNYGITHVKIGGEIDDVVKFAMHVNRQLPELVLILNKAIESITAQERQAIILRWYQPSIKINRINRLLETLLVIILAIMGLAFFGYLIQRNRSIKKIIANEVALRISKHRFDLAMLATNDGVWDWDMLTNEVYFSPRWKSMLGYENFELKNEFTTWENLTDSEGRSKTMKLIDECSAGRSDGFEIEFRMKHKDGHWVDILSRSTVVRDDQGTPVRMVGTHVDLSVKKRLEEQLRQAQKMESIGTLAGGIAHDFNNILSPIMLHSEIIMEDLPSDDPLNHNMKEIYQAGKRARDLVKQILIFARKTPAKKTILESSPIVKEAVRFLRSAIPTTIDIQYNNRAEQDTILADPTQLNQIVMNLCTNAAQAMKDGGILEVTLDNEDISIQKTNNPISLKPAHYLKLSVKDNGAGIADEDMDRIFEPYYTTKGPGEGTGLGLATVHGIVHNYGGNITVESQIGKGTTFHVYIPLAETDDSDINKPITALPKGNERILLVDDEKSVVDVMEKMLNKLGYIITAKTNSMEAFETFRNNPKAFDLVITDMTMPNITGKKLFSKLRELRSDIPIILCTGFSNQINEEEANAMGINAFIMKPIIKSEIAKIIREVLDIK